MKRLLLLTACAAAAACSADWRDASLPPQKRAELLTAEMTLDEKIGQLTSPYGWEMYERHGDSVRLTDAFREAVQTAISACYGVRSAPIRGRRKTCGRG